MSKKYPHEKEIVHLISLCPCGLTETDISIFIGSKDSKNKIFKNWKYLL